MQGLPLEHSHRLKENPPRILIVDDEKMLAWTLGILLSKVGYDVQTFNDPGLLLEEFRLNEADLVISDIVMPQMSGIDLAIQLKQHRTDCKIVLLSGQATTLHLLERSRAQGYDFEVFPKPIAPSELLRFVQEHVGSPGEL